MGSDAQSFVNLIDILVLFSNLNKLNVLLTILKKNLYIFNFLRTGGRDREGAKMEGEEEGWRREEEEEEEERRTAVDCTTVLRSVLRKGSFIRCDKSLFQM